MIKQNHRMAKPPVVVSLALALATALTLVPLSGYVFNSHAWAQTGEGGGSGTHGGGGGKYGSGTEHAPGSSGQSMGQGGSTGTRGHYGQGGSTGTETGEEGTSTDKKGPRYGGSAESRQPGESTQGGRPVWAKEGIPEVELGRLSVARSPASVLQHAYDETITNWSTLGTTVLTLKNPDGTTYTLTVAQLYSLPAAQFAQVVELNYDVVSRIDSPLENLALLKDVAADGTTNLTGVTPSSTNDLAAIFLGSASDKELPVTADTVIAVYTLLGLPAPTAEQAATVATSADYVRLAILSGHG